MPWPSPYSGRMSSACSTVAPASAATSRGAVLRVVVDHQDLVDQRRVLDERDADALDDGPYRLGLVPGRQAHRDDLAVLGVDEPRRRRTRRRGRSAGWSVAQPSWSPGSGDRGKAAVRIPAEATGPPAIGSGPAIDWSGRVERSSRVAGSGRYALRRSRAGPLRPRPPTSTCHCEEHSHERHHPRPSRLPHHDLGSGADRCRGRDHQRGPGLAGEPAPGLLRQAVRRRAARSCATSTCSSTTTTCGSWTGWPPPVPDGATVSIMQAVAGG